MENIDNMNAEQLAESLEYIDDDTASTIKGIVAGTILPESIPETQQWIDQCYNRPSDAELMMHAIDAVLENHGVELLGSSDGNGEYAYSNPGDPYIGTIIQNWETGEFFVGCWSDLVE